MHPELPEIPLIINSGGWVKGMGHDVLCTMVHALVPDVIVKFVGETNSKRFDLPDLDEKCRLVQLEAHANRMSPPTHLSALLRHARLRSYLLQNEAVCHESQLDMVGMIAREPNRIHRHVSLSLSAQTPFAIPFKNVYIHLNNSTVR